MRIAVAGATGNIGARVVAALQRSGHEVVAISRSNGVDLSTGEGLDAALAGVNAVVDVTNAPPGDRDGTVDYLGSTTGNLLAAEARVGVAHHVLLSIVGIHDIEGNAHYAGKREQERLIEAGPVPWTIVPATQFHDFAEMVVGWTEQDGPDGVTAPIAPLLVQPIDPDDVAAVLAGIAAGDPQGRHVDVAGPHTQDLVDMARRTLEVRGREVTLVPTWSSVFGVEMSGNALLPGDGARIAPTTFEQWLSRQR
ncbi:MULTISPECIES: SDR family oxidoreductase [unclassified Mycolicibacterium]|uniref:SDR family oxidoreductase n=1 Tax=unclassified Mycolicibacterium TaxID=2636767 RepID=UPI0012DE0780|nr:MULTISPECIES: NAD(P)H-binding protein [unclassified Mycolicibacterium]MUL80946.1 NAD(P)H-binding protein [Mycolicibacterium sp. CBMA 329]MUL86712.1 NAD(P)H-binding protein [Mycolicibacterium sp. CBMA 331]MUL99001.1 NAD(P)H-binding protein [Mycolicibacterium sp. CBMA 334]MUM28870.1 NAD(P)H-binding protein [Mycolicibacterium sp. CBMA 295]MUM37009.1 NAD(P)H-binding protein [Mycolicibacterium sp. CBMA 247]